MLREPSRGGYVHEHGLYSSFEQSGQRSEPAHEELQIRTPIDALEHGDSVPCKAFRGDVLAVLASEIRAAELLQACVDMSEEMQLGFDCKDGDGVPERVSLRGEERLDAKR
ncbi:hypothetical protein BS47DRAFT_1341159 [Hydnum rufescens UP504]|uniref:Uncharacterized protein n=1 Tax=Hydnum rufescens UP504 TaxID=1448309 RepID=A0A9P6DYQ1_9AGAM|nr:hypothetical protein BS47DRAFT_1341159 [Hydnum rufescens UP504]